jgi:rhodanese-related sulfurtransferase
MQRKWLPAQKHKFDTHKTSTFNPIPMKEISAPELKSLMDENKAPLVVDVRESYETDVSTLPGAVKVPLNNLMVNPEALEIEKHDAVVVYCRSGMRSASAASFLEQNGFQDVTNLRGGISAWQSQVDPNIKIG